MLVVSACNALDPNALTASKAAALLLPLERTNCPTIKVHAEALQGDQADWNLAHQLVTWERSTLDQDPKLIVAERKADGDKYENVTAHYVDDGVTREISWAWGAVGLAQYAVGFVDWTACVWEPYNVTISDITIDPSNPKQATVTYTVLKHPTPEGDALLTKTDWTPYNRIVVVVGVDGRTSRLSDPTVNLGQVTEEHRATLQRLDVGGWRVETLNGQAVTYSTGTVAATEPAPVPEPAPSPVPSAPTATDPDAARRQAAADGAMSSANAAVASADAALAAAEAASRTAPMPAQAGPSPPSGQ